MSETKTSRTDIDDLISFWSMRPQPGTPTGQAWEDGARQGWAWAYFRLTSELEQLNEHDALVAPISPPLQKIANAAIGWSPTCRAEPLLTTQRKVEDAVVEAFILGQGAPITSEPDEQSPSVLEAERKALEKAGNYVADRESEPREVRFADGRIVRVIGDGYLTVERADG